MKDVQILQIMLIIYWVSVPIFTLIAHLTLPPNREPETMFEVWWLSPITSIIPTFMAWFVLFSLNQFIPLHIQGL